MSTPPFIDAPAGVAVVRPPRAPAPVLLAEPAGASRGNALLVPGFTGSKEDFIAVLTPLARLGWRVAALDLPGQNGHPALGQRGSHDLAALAGSVAAVVTWFSADHPVHLVGHSLGGLVTRELLLADPAAVATWVPMCSGPAALPAAQWPQLVQLRDALGQLSQGEIFRLTDRANRAAGWTPPSAEVAQFLHDRFLRNDPDAMADLAELLMSAADRTDEVAALIRSGPVRTAVVTGELDDRWPLDEQRQMAARLSAPWHVLRGCGHSPAVEDPPATAQLLDQILAGENGS